MSVRTHPGTASSSTSAAPVLGLGSSSSGGMRYSARTLSMNAPVAPAGAAATTSDTAMGERHTGTHQSTFSMKPSYPQAAVNHHHSLQQPNSTSHNNTSLHSTNSASSTNDGALNGFNKTNSSGSGVSSSAATATESVIEELKALARSMLEATNAARRRTSSIEQRNSYEALMHVIERRVNNNAAIDGGSGGNGALAAAAGPVHAPSIPLAPSAAETATAPMTTRHVDPQATGDVTRSQRLSAPPIDGLTDIPAGLSLASGARPSPSPRGSPDQCVSAARGAALSDRPAQPMSPPIAPQPQSERRHADETKTKTNKVQLEANSDDDDEEEDEEEEEEEDDGTVYDGVKTQILFKPVNGKAYREVVVSLWKPEEFVRDVDAVAPSSKDHRSGSGSAEKSSSSPGRSDAEEEEEGGKEGAVVTVPTRNKTKGKAKPTPAEMSVKVFRVPVFPYGGGVTRVQARLLQRQFNMCVRSGLYRSPNAAGPIVLRLKDFAKSRYDEVATATAQVDTASFQPTSPYEFVVEVEREVRFDAVKAREERRRRFKQLVRENRAPATMGAFNLRVIMDPFKTGFEEEKNFPIIAGTVIAGRYEIIEMLGKATFSRAVRCNDLHDPIYDEADDEESVGEEEEKEKDGEEKNGTASAEVPTTAEDSASASPTNSDAAADAMDSANDPSDAALSHASHGCATANSMINRRQEKGKTAASSSKRKRTIVGYGQVCLKIINNNKDFFDQSLDEIRLLTLLNSQRDADEVHIVRLIDAFYFKEHVMLVTELLRDTLYDYGKYNREEEEEFYFTVPRLRRITRQIVEALAYVHSLNLIHTDLKPENIMFVSYSRCLVKVIDFGSSCFLSDHLSSYIQSRSYRAPEVVLGCDYDGRIDVWSLGAILVEMVTGDVLFTSDTVPEMLARIVYVCGMPFPRRMLWEGRHTSDYINKFGCIYEYSGSRGGADGQRERSGCRDGDDSEETYCLYTPVPAMPPHTCASRKSKTVAPPRSSTAPYSVLREKLAAANMVDEEFISFVTACLNLNHKKRLTSAELLEHPFIKNERL